MNLRIKQPQPISLAKPVLIGAAIGLALITLFLSGIDDPDPAWGKLWKVRPFIVVPLAGAAGGLFFWFMDQMSFRGMNRTLSVIIGLIGFIVALWMGSVLGLAGTLWN